MKQVVTRFINYVRDERGLSPVTLRSYRNDLRKFIRFLEEQHGKNLLPGDVTSDMIQSFMGFLATSGYRRRNSPASRAKRLATLRSFFKYLHSEGLVGNDPAADIRGPKVKFTEPHYLQSREYVALMKAAEQSENPFLAIRNKALLATFLCTGARVSELLTLNLKDLSLRSRRVRLHRKGGEVQTLPVSEELVAILRKYLKMRRGRAHCRAVFVSIRGRRLRQQSVWSIVDRCATLARLPKARISPHSLRHTFATTLLANGENLQTIRILMNHKSLSTTARYLHTRDEQLDAAVNAISLKMD